MEALKIEAGDNTPYIFLDAQDGHFEIKGKSSPENAVFFYQPLMHWLGQYILSPNEETIFDFKLTYYNTASSKILLDVMRKLETLAQTHTVLLRWHYEEYDEDMQELGEDYAAVINLPFEHIVCETIE